MGRQVAGKPQAAVFDPQHAGPVLNGGLEGRRDGIAEHLQGHHQLHQLQPLLGSGQGLGHGFGG